MLSRKYRIPAIMFPGVTRGKTLMNEYVRIVLKYDDTLKNPKCGVIVATKLAKTAVIRNKLRRQVYEILGLCLDFLPIAYISVYPKMKEVSYAELEKAIKDLLCSKK